MHLGFEGTFIWQGKEMEGEFNFLQSEQESISMHYGGNTKASFEDQQLAYLRKQDIADETNSYIYRTYRY